MKINDDEEGDGRIIRADDYRKGRSQIIICTHPIHTYINTHTQNGNTIDRKYDNKIDLILLMDDKQSGGR